MLDTPQIAQTTNQLTAVIRLTIPRAEIRNVMGPGIAELMAAVAAQGIGPAGPWFTHHLRMDPATFDFEICVPVTAPVAASGRVKAGHLPATTVARTTYHGSYEGLGGAWAVGKFVLATVLAQISGTDPAIFVGVPILLTLVALAACYVPARRASRLDPLDALRSE